MPSSQGSQPEKPRKTAGNGAGRGSAGPKRRQSVFAIRQQVLRRIFTARRRTAWKQSRASSARCSSHRATPSRNASRKLTRNIFMSRRTKPIYTVLVGALECRPGDRPDHVHASAARPEPARERRAALHSSPASSRSCQRQRTFSTTSTSFATNTFSAKSSPLPPRASGALTRNRTRSNNLLDEVEQRIFAVG